MVKEQKTCIRKIMKGTIILLGGNMINFSTLNEIPKTLNEIGVLPSVLFIGGALYTGILILFFLVKGIVYVAARFRKAKS